jgi:hypothetical protein
MEEVSLKSALIYWALFNPASWLILGLLMFILFKKY